MKQLELRRTGETFRAFGRQGCRGVLLLGEHTFYSLERGDGYKWLRPGLYTLEIARMNNGTPALRVLGDYSNGRIYLHAATRPGHLKGCIAAGLSSAWSGVKKPRPAMSLIFTELGGFDVGTKCTLKVVGRIA